MWDFFIKMVTAHSGLSVKRVCGFIGWMTCIGISIYCTICCMPAPNIIDTLFICSTSLLGIDTITNIIHGRKWNK